MCFLKETAYILAFLYTLFSETTEGVPGPAGHDGVAGSAHQVAL